MQSRCVSKRIGIPSSSDIAIQARITGIMPATVSGMTCPITTTKGAPNSLAICKVGRKASIDFGKSTRKGVKLASAIIGWMR